MKLATLVIRRFPESALAGQVQYHLEDDSFEFLVQEWLKQAESYAHSTVVLNHAASFCKFSRRDVSEKLWSNARELAPEDIWFSYQLAKLYRSYLYDEVAESKSYFERSLHEWSDVLAKFKMNPEPNGAGSFLNSYLLEQDSIKFAEEALEQKLYYHAKHLAYRLLRSKGNPRGYGYVHRNHIAWSIIGRIYLAEGNNASALKQLLKMMAALKSDGTFTNDLEVKLSNELLSRGNLEDVIQYVEFSMHAYRSSMLKTSAQASKLIASRIESLEKWMNLAKNAHAEGKPYRKSLKLPEF